MSNDRSVQSARSAHVTSPALRQFAAICFSAAVLAAPSGAGAQPQPRRTFSSPQEAVSGLVEVARSGQLRRLRDIFGSEVDRLMSDDTVQMRKDFETFANRATEFAEATQVSTDRYEVIIGDERWPFPVPLERVGRGWQFDTEAGVEEVLARWIGQNELNTVSVLEALAAAQWDYFLDSDWDHDQVQEFAPRLLSSPGSKDGLYWPTAPQEPASPLGALIALASDEGYVAGGDEPTPYHGYRFRVLPAQGPSAPGGAHPYVVNGNMINGFAVVAYPASYGVSGVMTFIVNQQGRVYERDLGAETESIAARMDAYDPDPGWKPVARVK